MSAAIVMFHGPLTSSTRRATSAVLQSVSRSSQVTLDLSDVDAVDDSFLNELVSVYADRLSEENPAAVRIIARLELQEPFQNSGLNRCVELYAEGDKRAADIRLVELLGMRRVHPLRNAEVLVLH